MHGDDNTAVRLHGDRISPAMRRRIAGHPDPTIRDAYADSVRGMVDREVLVGIDDLEEAYGRPRAALVSATSPSLRAAVARAWYDRPLAVQVELLADPDPQVRAAATARRHPGIPPEWRECCLADLADLADLAVRVNVARYVPLTSEQFAQLMRSEEEEVHQAVAGNPHLSAEMVARLLDIDDPLVRIAAAQSRHVDAETRDRLYALVEAERADGSIEAEVALSWNFAEPDWLREAPLTERMTYLDCQYTTFRRVLASCHDLPEEAWRRLDNDPELVVRRAAARRPDTPPEVHTATYSTSVRYSSTTPTSPVTCCARSLTNQARTCATWPCKTQNYLCRTFSNSPPLLSPSCAAGSPVTPTSRTRCSSICSLTQTPR